MSVSPTSSNNQTIAPPVAPQIQRNSKDFGKALQETRRNEGANSANNGNGRNGPVRSEQPNVQARDQRHPSDGHGGKQTKVVNGVRVTLEDGRVTSRLKVSSREAQNTSNSTPVTSQQQAPKTTGLQRGATEGPSVDASRVADQPRQAGQPAVNLPSRPVETRSSPRGGEIAARSGPGEGTGATVMNDTIAVRSQQNGGNASGGDGGQGQGNQGQNTGGGSADTGGTNGGDQDAGGSIGGGGGNIRPTATGASPEEPDGPDRIARLAEIGITPPTSTSKAIGQLSIMFEMNINPALREIIDDVRRGSRIPQYDALPERGESIAVRALLNEGFSPALAEQNGRHLDTLARAMNLNTSELAARLVDKKTEAQSIVARFQPATPLLVNTGLYPPSMQDAIRYFTSLLSLGISIPQTQHLIEDHVVDVPATIALPGSSYDMDGVIKIAKPVMKGIDVKITSPDSRIQNLHIKLPDDFVGVPVEIEGVRMTTPPQAVLRLRDGTVTAVDISEEDAATLSTARTKSLDFMDGVTARTFAPGAVRFLQELSRSTIKGTINPGVPAHPATMNTLGPIGTRPGEGSPCLMVNTLWRGLPLDQTTEPMPLGFHGAQGVHLYSGGASKTHGSEGIFLEFFGVQDAGAAGAVAMAARLPSLFDEICDRYGLSDTARAEMQKLVFTSDSIAVPLSSSVIAELNATSRPGDPNSPFRTLQADIEQRLQAMLVEYGMEESHFIHHTPAGPGDTLLLWTGPRSEYTGEWNVVGKGVKVLPALDFLLNQLRKTQGIDLLPAMESLGASYINIRQLNMEQMDDVIANLIRPLALLYQRGGNVETAVAEAGLTMTELQSMTLSDVTETLTELEVLTSAVDRAEAAAAENGVTFGPLFPTYIIAADTISEGADGKLKGSDASMERVFRKFCESSVLVMIETLAGQPPRLGRNPAFEQVFNPSTNTLELVRTPIDPNGPNGNRAPVAFFATQTEFGSVLDAAFKSQSEIPDELLRVNP